MKKLHLFILLAVAAACSKNSHPLEPSTDATRREEGIKVEAARTALIGSWTFDSTITNQGMKDARTGVRIYKRMPDGHYSDTLRDTTYEGNYKVEYKAAGVKIYTNISTSESTPGKYLLRFNENGIEISSDEFSSYFKIALLSKTQLILKYTDAYSVNDTHYAVTKLYFYSR